MASQFTYFVNLYFCVAIITIQLFNTMNCWYTTRTCSESSSTDMCEITCSGCYIDDLECSSDMDCSIDCTGCWQSDILCPTTNDNNCNITCTGDSSCESVDINTHSMALDMTGDMYIECNGEESCQNTDIYCSQYGNCYLYCNGEDSCDGLQLYCSNSNGYQCNCDDNSNECNSVTITYWEDLFTSSPTTTEMTDNTNSLSTTEDTIDIVTTDNLLNPSTTTSSIQTSKSTNTNGISTTNIPISQITTDSDSNDDSNDSQDIQVSEGSNNNNDSNLSKKKNTKDKSGLIAALVIVSCALAAVLCIMLICCFRGIRRINKQHHLNLQKNGDKTVISSKSSKSKLKVSSIEPTSDYPEDLEPGSPRMMSLENSIQNVATTDNEPSSGNNPDGNYYNTGYMQNGRIQVMDGTDQEDDVIESDHDRQHRKKHYKSSYHISSSANAGYAGYRPPKGNHNSSNGNNSPTSSVEGRRSRLHSALNESMISGSKQSIGSIIFPTPAGHLKNLPKPPARGGIIGIDEDNENVNDNNNVINDYNNSRIPGAKHKRRRRARTEPVLNDQNGDNNDIDVEQLRRRSRLQGEASPQSSMNIEAIVEGDNDNDDVEYYPNNNGLVVSNVKNENSQNNEINDDITPGAAVPEALEAGPGTIPVDDDEKDEKESEELETPMGNRNKKENYKTRRQTVGVLASENYSVASNSSGIVGYNIV